MYTTIFVAGTFDRLHKGHEAVLRRAFGLGEKVTIGLTSEKFLQEYKPQIKHRSFEERKDGVSSWIRSNGFEPRTEIISIDNPHEPAASGPYQALIVTRENRTRGEEINAKRMSKNLSPLALIEVPMIVAKDGQPISSTRIRSGEIDEEGNLIMPDILRETLQKPLGRILSQESEIKESIERNKDKIVISVGDVSTKTLMKHDKIPNLSIIDLLVQREPRVKLTDYEFDPETHIVSVVSGPGYISVEASKTIWEWSQSVESDAHKPWVIIVHGEEDLLVLPVIQHVSIPCVVYYGQPDLKKITTKNSESKVESSALSFPDSPHEGLVEVPVTDDIKEKVGKILAKFT